MYLVILLMIDVRPQVQLEDLLLPFSLTVNLRVVRGTELPFDAQVVAECCSDFSDKLGPTIGLYTQRDSSAS